MFQLWKLVLLCGLLAGTSESLLGDLGNDLSNVVENVKPALENGLETVDNTLDADLPKLSVDLDVLQKSKVWQLAKQKIQEAGNLMDNALNLVNSVKEKTLGVEISNSLIQDIKSELTADGNGINLRFPVTADVAVVLPLIGKVVNLQASLDLLSGVRIETNVQNSLSTVVLGECTSDPINVSLSLLGRHSELVNRIVDTVTSSLKQIVSSLVSKEVCPLIRSIVDTLDMSFIQNAITDEEEDCCDARLLVRGRALCPNAQGPVVKRKGPEDSWRIRAYLVRLDSEAQGSDTGTDKDPSMLRFSPSAA
ncbi:BPI fold-containing family A member 2 [Cynocephalus volans]|uniref:BPI fold-containing family A member 2 n=1 Tax=Cynocephalus volans TaxID=110931 RepID=UPI002FC6C58D